MTEREKAINALECNLNLAKVAGKFECEQCGYNCEKTMFLSVPVNLLVDALALLKAQMARHKLEVHNIGNVDIPDGVTEEQFHAVMSNVVDALEHTDRGEAWPYDSEGVEVG